MNNDNSLRKEIRMPDLIELQSSVLFQERKQKTWDIPNKTPNIEETKVKKNTNRKIMQNRHDAFRILNEMKNNELFLKKNRRAYNRVSSYLYPNKNLIAKTNREQLKPKYSEETFIYYNFKIVPEKPDCNESGSDNLMDRNPTELIIYREDEKFYCLVKYHTCISSEIIDLTQFLNGRHILKFHLASNDVTSQDASEILRWVYGQCNNAKLARLMKMQMWVDWVKPSNDSGLKQKFMDKAHQELGESNDTQEMKNNNPQMYQCIVDNKYNELKREADREFIKQQFLKLHQILDEDIDNFMQLDLTDKNNFFLLFNLLISLNKSLIVLEDIYVKTFVNGSQGMLSKYESDGQELMKGEARRGLQEQEFYIGIVQNTKILLERVNLHISGQVIPNRRSSLSLNEHKRLSGDYSRHLLGSIIYGDDELFNKAKDISKHLVKKHRNSKDRDIFSMVSHEIVKLTVQKFSKYFNNQSEFNHFKKMITDFIKKLKTTGRLDFDVLMRQRKYIMFIPLLCELKIVQKKCESDTDYATPKFCFGLRAAAWITHGFNKVVNSQYDFKEQFRVIIDKTGQHSGKSLDNCLFLLYDKKRMLYKLQFKTKTEGQPKWIWLDKQHTKKINNIGLVSMANETNATNRNQPLYGVVKGFRDWQMVYDMADSRKRSALGFFKPNVVANPVRQPERITYTSFVHH